MERIDYPCLKDQVFEIMDNCGSAYDETKALCMEKGLPFGLREEAMVSSAIGEYHGWTDEEQERETVSN